MFVELNDRALASVEQRTSRKGAILVPNSCLARGNGQYIQQVLHFFTQKNKSIIH